MLLVMQSNGLKIWNIKILKKYYLHITLNLFTVNVIAQPSNIAWFSGNMPIKISEKWQWHNDASFRTTFQTTAQLIYRTGIVYNLNKNIKCASGYAISYAKNYANKIKPEYGIENRIWQEIVLQSKISPFFSVRNRLRTEQQFFEATSTKSKYNASRYRYRVDGICSINSKWQFDLFNEYMIQHSHNKTYFDQNRTQFNIVYKCTTNLHLLTGFMALYKSNNFTQKVLVFSFSKLI
jgi:hypothetical protein